MTSGWACTSEDLVVDLQVDLQNDATFIQTVSFGLLRLDCFLPSLNRASFYRRVFQFKPAGFLLLRDEGRNG